MASDRSRVHQVGRLPQQPVPQLVRGVEPARAGAGIACVLAWRGKAGFGLAEPCNPSLPPHGDHPTPMVCSAWPSPAS